MDVQQKEKKNMVKTKDELLNILKERIGEDTSDEALAFIEDVTDTITDLETRAAGDGEDWKKKYEENDAAWRSRYKERFFGGESKDQTENKEKSQDDDDEKPLTFDSLFTEEKK